MKKITFVSILLLLISFSSRAQFFVETWDAPAAWTSNDADGDGNDWGLQDISGSGLAISGLGNVAFSESWNSFPLTPDNYLESPALDFSAITGTIMLSFDVASADPNFEAENYSVYVVTDLTTLGTAIPVFSETIPVGDVVFNHVVDISSFAGQAQVFVVFRHHACTDMYQLYVDNIMLYNSDFTVDQVVGCTDVTSYTFTDASVGATSWDWNFGAGASPATAVGQGPHVVTYSSSGLKTVSLTTDNIAMQTKVDLIDVTLNDDATFSYPLSSYCVGAANDFATVTGTVGGTFSSPTPGFVLDVNTGELDLSTFGVGTYDVTYTTPVGTCQVSSTIQIDIIAAPMVNNPGDQLVCEGASTTDVLFTGTATQYDWTYTNGSATNIGIPFSGTGDILSFVAQNGTGAQVVSTFDITPSSGSCTGAVVQFTITVDPIESAAFSYAQTSYCLSDANPTPAITGNAGGVFSVIPAGLTFADAVGTIDLTLTAANSYDITYTTSGPCPVSTTVTVLIGDNPFVNQPADQVLCSGSATTDVLFTGGVGSQFDWTNSDPSIGLAASGTGDILSFIATNLTGVPVVATIDVTPSVGTCVGAPVQFTFTVNPTDDPAFSYAQASYCTTEVDPTANITGTAGGTFSFVPAGLVIDMFTGLIDLSATAPNTYDITYTTGGSCPASLTIQLPIGNAPSVNPVGNQVFCEGIATTDIIFTGSPGSVFDWTNTDPTIGIAASGTGDILSFIAANGTGAQLVATIDVTPSVGTCVGTPTSFTFTVDPSEDASFTLSSASICSNDPTAPVTTIVGTAGGSFTSGVGLTINLNTGAIDVTTSTAGNYTVTYQTPGSCSATSSLPFDIIAAPVVNPMINDTVCHNQSFPLVNFTSATNPVFNWINDNTNTGLSSLSGTGDIASFSGTNPLPGGAPVVSNIKVYGVENGCTSDTVYFALQVNANPSVNGGADRTLCEGTAITMTAIGTAASFTWDNGITQGVSFTPVAGAYIYTVTGTTNGCSVLDQVNVTVNPSPVVVAGPDLIVCAGSQTILTGSGAPTLSWNNGAVDNAPFVPIFSGDYILTGVSNNGCSSRDTMNLTIEALPIPSFTADIISGCGPLTVIFNSSNTTNNCVYSFSDGTTALGCFNVAHTFLGEGIYDVTLTQVSANFCTGSTMIPAMIVVNPDPVANFTAFDAELDMINPTTSFLNTSTGALTYEWDFGDQSGIYTDFEPIHSFPGDEANEFTVSLTAITQFGCRDTIYGRITIDESLLFYVPNSFTPNGDEFNNKFEPVFYSGIDPLDYNMKVYNRFGELIFESRNADEGWDGDYGAGRGLAPAGIYTFKIEFSTVDKDEKKLVVGYVNVLR